MFSLSGVKLRKAFLLACISVLPDFDVLFGVHRSISHSAIVWLAVVAPLLVYFWRYEPQRVKDVLLVFFSACLHCLFDLSGYTPVLWPLTMNSLKIDFSLFVHVEKSVLFDPVIGVTSIASDFKTFNGFDAPIFTSQSFITSLALLSPVLLKAFNESKESWIESGWIPRPVLSSFRSLFHSINENLKK